jgi:hypothetical protein
VSAVKDAAAAMAAAAAAAVGGAAAVVAPPAKDPIVELEAAFESQPLAEVAESADPALLRVRSVYRGFSLSLRCAMHSYAWRASTLSSSPK